MTKVVDFVFKEAKGDKIRTSVNVGDDVADEICGVLDVSYVAVEISVLHKPFLKFTDLNSKVHIYAIEDIRKVRIMNAAAAVGP